MSLFASTGGGFDWGGFANQAAGIIGNIYQTKAQTKLLRQMNRMNAGQWMAAARGQMAPPIYTGGIAQSFLPATVPAAGGGLGSLGGLGGLLGGGGMIAGAAGLLPNLLPGGLEEVGSGTGLFGLDMFEPTKSGQRARKVLRATNPSTGNDTYWRHVGAPMLFRGDLRVAKLVNKVAQRAARGRARCGPTFRKRRR